MPDYYTVALEIWHGRTTKARMETCSADDARPCPRGVDVGDSFVYRELNEPCHQLVSSVYCCTRPPAANILKQGWANYGPPMYIMRPVGTYMFARFLKFYSEYLIRTCSTVQEHYR